MKFKSQYLALITAGLTLSSCIAPLVIGGGATVGAIATKEKGITGTASDSQISVVLKAKLYQFDPSLYSQVTVNVQSGEVLLAGIVTKAEWQAEAERIAWEVNGVTHVVNHIETSEEGTGVGTIMQDSVITTQVKANLFCDGDIRSLNYSIKTVNGVVYIMGIAQSQEELDKVGKYASSVKGVQKVMSYAKVKDGAPTKDEAPAKDEVPAEG
ncbi:MAG: BON domain-containing protein [Alphaproteobacteria bacterium]|nr:BON domain-containing protein [Alphaproteobacteria bacterium]